MAAGAGLTADHIRPQRLRYLALGDSYTIGEGVAADECWPLQLTRALRGDSLQIDDPQIIATTGWTTDALEAGIETTAPDQAYDLVSLGIGVNNQYQGRPIDEYRMQLSTLLERAVACAGGRPARVLMLSIPDWGCTPFAVAAQRDGPTTSRQIDAFNATACTLCSQRHIGFVDITAISRARGMEPAMLADDGLHPSARMYALWTARVLPAARRALAGAP